MRDLFRTNSSDLINQLYNLFVSKKYGDVIYYTEVEKILGFDKTTGKYGIYVKKAKDRAIENKKVLKSIPGIGWQVLKPKQISSYTYRKYIRRALNMYDYSDMILNDGVEIEVLDEVRIEEYNHVKELNAKMKEVSKRTIESSRYYSRKAYYDSLED